MADPRLQGPAVQSFAGCAIHPEELGALLDRVTPRLWAGEQRLLVGHHNLHSLYLYHRNPSVTAFYQQCTACYVDGVPVLWLLRAAGLELRDGQRFSFMDNLPELFAQAQARGLRVFYLGGRETSIRTAQNWVAEEWPDLVIGWHHGYFKDSPAVVAAINAFQPDLLLVGMGMPRQEQWILQYLEQLQVGAVLQAGGTVDYYTGAQARPPAQLSRLGLGWLYRLLHDPRRLWRRYLVTPWTLILPWLRLRRALRHEPRSTQ